MADKVLLVCSSTPANVRRAIQRFPNDAVFQDYDLDLLCTAGDLPELEAWTQIRQRLVFPKRNNYSAAARLWSRVVRERYAVVVVLWCLEPGKTLAKIFPLLCLGRQSPGLQREHRLCLPELAVSLVIRQRQNPVRGFRQQSVGQSLRRSFEARSLGTAAAGPISGQAHGLAGFRRLVVPCEGYRSPSLVAKKDPSVRLFAQLLHLCLTRRPIGACPAD